ncbi:MAG: ABC transporter ATP-binding protein [Desulfofustis sp.]|nr:ABC transporter ATP-binding protein [Desulfofustis sp.]
MLSAVDIEKSFPYEDAEVKVLKGVTVHLDEGDYVAIVGRSGSGKTTLLNVLSTLVRPDNGLLTYEGADLSSAAEKELNEIRRADFSVIFQFHHLLPYLSVLENTLLPFMGTLRPVSGQLQQRALDCLDRVGLADKARRLPGSLSGGEQQRVAIARALVKSSKILFADEPTGSLDRTTGEQIMELLAELHGEGLTIVMVTLERAFAQLARRTIEIEDGLIIH